MNTKLNLLINDHKFNEGTARAYLESEGKCVYCGVDLLKDISTYYAADIDHLLPKSKYPEIESDIDNWVLSCRACNSIKGRMDIPDLPWTPKEAVKEHKKELIIIISEYLAEKRAYKENELRLIRQIVQGDMRIIMSKQTTDLGYENRNGQINLDRTGEEGTDHMQYFYKMQCKYCNHEYRANGSDIFQRRCPKCQGGKP